MKRFLFILLFASSALAQSIESIAPRSAPASGGVFVHIYGENLKGFALACPTIECGDYVKFGDVLGGIAVNTGDEIVVLAPPHAPGTVDVTVNVAGKAKLTLPSAFTYETATTVFERVLLPVVLSGITATQGAFGSLWKGETTFHNASDQDVSIGVPCQQIVLAPCEPAVIRAHSTVAMSVFGTPGAFMSIPRKNIGDVDILLRIQDVSRQSQTWGTAIPVVRGTDFKPRIRLVGLPTEAGFRLTLRVYGYGNASPVLIRMFPSSADMQLHLQSQNPAYLQLDVPLGTTLIEVSSASDPPQPIWAFVSVTNNETQHVTVVAPSP